MQASVALPTNVDASSQFRFAVVLFEKRTPMHFLWDQMVKSQKRFSFAQYAHTEIRSSWKFSSKQYVQLSFIFVT